MKTFSRLQIASGIALLVSVLVLLKVHALNSGLMERIYCAVLVCAFGFLFMSRDGVPQEEEEPWWW